MALPSITLGRGIHVQHLFYRIDRVRWLGLPHGESRRIREKLEGLVAQWAGPAHPRLMTFVTVGGKADLAFALFCAELQQLSAMHRAVEQCFPAGTLIPVFSFLSVTELPEYVSTDDDLKAMLAREGITESAPTFADRFEAAQKRNLEYQFYRLNPELDSWEIMCFYPMSKRRLPGEKANWYSLDFATRKQLMAGHAKTGRKYAGRISQLITGSTGLDDWEWGVTLMAHQLDAVKEIVYEMRFDEVTARYGDFGPFYINLTAAPADQWAHLGL